MRKQEKTINRILGELGLNADITRSRHIKIRLSGPKGDRMVIAGYSPSDHRETQNLKTQIKRSARECGLLE